MASSRRARRGAWCLSKCAEFAAQRHVRICRLLVNEDESVVRISGRLAAWFAANFLRRFTFEQGCRWCCARWCCARSASR